VELVFRRDSSVGIATRLRAGRPRNMGSIPIRVQEIFLFSIAFIPALGSFQSLGSWYQGLVPRG
jgi:hypothetical protein